VGDGRVLVGVGVGVGRARVWFGGRSDPAIIVLLPSLPVPVSQSLQSPNPKAGAGAGDPIRCSYTGRRVPPKTFRATTGLQS
jgi:hypothetical protein